MKLLVIVLCLLSERYLVHAISHLRFSWFPAYVNYLQQLDSSKKTLIHPPLLLLAIVLPLLILCGLLLFIFDDRIFGILSFLFNLGIFYYCLGPENPFYPVKSENEEDYNEIVVGNYFVKVNGQLFAPVFWYITLGVLGIVAYRLISLCKEQPLIAKLSTLITDILDWIPARISVILFLLVGNFQRGLNFFLQKFFTAPENNALLLSEGGLLAARTNENESVQMPYAESLVEHAVIVYLVFLALFTLVALL